MDQGTLLTDPDQDPAHSQESGKSRKTRGVDTYDIEAGADNNPRILRCSLSFQ
jgi:hypothetical protein